MATELGFEDGSPSLSFHLICFYVSVFIRPTCFYSLWLFLPRFSSRIYRQNKKHPQWVLFVLAAELGFEKDSSVFFGIFCCLSFKCLLSAIEEIIPRYIINITKTMINISTILLQKGYKLFKRCNCYINQVTHQKSLCLLIEVRLPPRAYRCTLPEASPPFNFSTSANVTLLKSPIIECFKQLAATANSSACAVSS